MMLKSTNSSILGRRVSRASNGTRTVMRAGNWLPGSDNYGFDPLGLAKDSDSLARFREAELIHGRWAMLGAAGCLAVEVLGFGNWAEAPLWALNGGNATWFGVEVPFDINTLLGIEFISFAIAEGLRNDNQDREKRCYPGGAFDPLGFSKDAKNFESYKLKEVKNGRLAMVATLGFLGQHAATGKGPIAALSEHIANPWGVNFATNGVSVPGL